MPSASVELKIPFHDVDMMRITWHGHYAKYFEVARCALLDKIEYNINEMQASGFGWPVIDLHIRYIKPLLYSDTIIVTSTIQEYENRLKIKYEIWNGDRTIKHAKGHTIQVAVSMPHLEMHYVSPDILYEKIQKCSEKEI